MTSILPALTPIPTGLTPEKLALINLITRVGLDGALIIWKTLASSPTIDDAIAALEKSASKSWEQYKAGT